MIDKVDGKPQNTSISNAQEQKKDITSIPKSSLYYRYHKIKMSDNLETKKTIQTSTNNCQQNTINPKQGQQKQLVKQLTSKQSQRTSKNIERSRSRQKRPKQSSWQSATKQKNQRGSNRSQQNRKRISSDRNDQAYFFKTKLCPQFNEGNCKKGQSCKYAHGQKQLRYLPNYTKTRLCVNYRNGKCSKTSEQCRYAHGESQLRKDQYQGNQKRKQQKSESSSRNTNEKDTKKYLSGPINKQIMNEHINQSYSLNQHAHNSFPSNNHSYMGYFNFPYGLHPYVYSHLNYEALNPQSGSSYQLKPTANNLSFQYPPPIYGMNQVDNNYHNYPINYPPHNLYYGNNPNSSSL